jgi:hypothetical protein
MTDERSELLIRQAIGGDSRAAAWIEAQVDVTEEPMVLVMAALLADLPDVPSLLDRAAAAASYREDRQLVAIARAHLAGDRELVDALARDHLVDFPGNYLVAWVASGVPVTGGGRNRGHDRSELSERE